MTAKTYQADVPESIVHFDPEDESREGPPIPVEFEWTEGTPPSGISGPPENYDPGEGDYFNIVSHDFDDATEERVIEWLDQHWQRPEPDWDYLNDLRDEGDVFGREEDFE